MLDLAISPRVCHRDILDRDAPFIVEVPEISVGECRPQVGDDVVRKAEPMNDVVEQLGCLLRCSLDQGFVLNPLRKFIDADVDLVEFS